MRRRHRVLMAAGLLAPACSPAPTAHRGAQSSATPPAETPGTDATAAPAATSTVPAPMESAGAGLPSPAPAGPTTTVTFTVPTTPRTTTTFVVPEREDEELTDDEWWEAQPGYVAPARELLLACIRSYEQNGNPKAGPTGYATDTGNGYFGAYQFDLPTWRSVGGSGNPAHAAPAEQDARAWALYQSRGLVPWPTPARRCG